MQSLASQKFPDSDMPPPQLRSWPHIAPYLQLLCNSLQFLHPKLESPPWSTRKSSQALNQLRPKQFTNVIVQTKISETRNSFGIRQFLHATLYLQSHQLGDGSKLYQIITFEKTWLQPWNVQVLHILEPGERLREPGCREAWNVRMNNISECPVGCDQTLERTHNNIQIHNNSVL